MRRYAHQSDADQDARQGRTGRQPFEPDYVALALAVLACACIASTAMRLLATVLCRWVLYAIVTGELICACVGHAEQGVLGFWMLLALPCAVRLIGAGGGAFKATFDALALAGMFATATVLRLHACGDPEALDLCADAGWRLSHTLSRPLSEFHQACLTGFEAMYAGFEEMWRRNEYLLHKCWVIGAQSVAHALQEWQAARSRCMARRAHAGHR